MRLPMVMTRGEGGDVLLGRFPDPVNTSELIAGAFKLQLTDETIIDEEDTADKSTEKYRRKQMRRRYRRKSNLNLQTKRGAKYEGAVASSMLGDPLVNNDGVPSAAAEVSRYVLLKVNADRTEVQVIPVDDWYNFRKPSVVSDKFLDEIDEDFELQKSLANEKNARYKKITSVLNRADESVKKSSAGEGDDEDDTSRLFGRKKKKKGGSKGGLRGFKMHSFLDEAMAANTGEDVDGDDGREQGGEAENDQDDASDDEEANVDEEQLAGERDIEEEAARAIEAEDEGAAGSGAVSGGDLDEDDEDDEEDEDDEDDDVTGRPANAKLADEFEAAREFKIHQRKLALREGDEGRQQPQEQQQTDTNSKRRRPEESVAIEAAGFKRVKTEASTLLRDEDIRLYISSVGGRVALKELSKQFKAKIKAEGMDKFFEIVKRNTTTVADAVHGKLLVLK